MSLVRPEYILQAARTKFGTETWTILGANEADVNSFWSSGSLIAMRIDQPVEVGRYVIDVEVKEVYNDGSEPKEVEINTLHAKSQDKIYRLSQSKYGIFDGNLSASISPEFFQMIPIRLGTANYYEGVQLQLSNKGYGTATKVEVPPLSKVTATITTRTIAYQANSLVQVSFPRNSSIRITRKVKSCTGIFCCCCCCCPMSTVIDELSLQELLTNNGVEDLQFTDGRVFFNEPRVLSYMGEVVEMRLAEPICSLGPRPGDEAKPIWTNKP